MKKLLFLLFLFFGVGFINAQAQDETTVKTDEDEIEVKTEREPVEAEQPKERSKVGNALHETGSAIGSGAKWTGKKVGKGVSWTWDKMKHNKLTKNIFNQPRDQGHADVEAEVENGETEVEIEE